MFENIFYAQRNFYKLNCTREIEFRKRALTSLKNSLSTHKEEIVNAFLKDLNKDEVDTLLTEMLYVQQEIDFTLKHLHEWAASETVPTAPMNIGTKSEIIKEPYGQTLIIAPWNYPLNLSLTPLIGAIAAGNTVILKPSEYTPNVAKVLGKIIQDAFDPRHVTQVEGDKEVTQSLLKQQFDYIFYTGSSTVGKIVMKAASEHLTPITLELGGKSPCIVHEDAKLNIAVKRILWGKMMNAGQTCVAPDYLIVHESIKEKFIELLKEEIERTYMPLYHSGKMTRIVNKDHFNRVKSMIKGDIIHGGHVCSEHFLISPTVIDISQEMFNHPTMQEEIFGPILPIISYRKPEEVVRIVENKKDPLALYVFSETKYFQDYILRNIPFGGGCINDVLFHLVSPYLPFGGRGNSGMGQYHGKYSFDTFTHDKSILTSSTKVDIPFRYPKYKSLQKLMKFFM